MTFALPALAETRLEQWKEQRAARQDSKERALAPAPLSVTKVVFEDREIILHIPQNLPPQGSRAMIVVLHGGMGNAEHIQSGLGMDSVADKDGFIVAYLNGTQATRGEDDTHKTWNAGNCCGQSARRKIDDTRYITDAVASLSARYGIDKKRIFVMGHSNGGMMTQRLMCESNVLAAGIPISGPLGLENASCTYAKGKKILAIHGADDLNVPITGGKGTKGISGADFKSQAYSKQIFESAGATYTLDIVNGADHNLLNIDKALKARGGKGVAETAADFFGLD